MSESTSTAAQTPRDITRFSSSISALVSDRLLIAVAATTVFTLMMLTMRLMTIRTTSTAPRFRAGVWLLADVGTNLPAAALIGLVVLLVGAVAAADGRRWGNGLLAGSAASLVGVAALILGLVERPAQAVQLSANLPSAQPYTTTITRHLGWTATAAVLIAAGFVAVVAFTRLDRRSDEAYDRRGAWAAIGLVGLAGIGTTIPVGDASITDNLVPSTGFPAAFLIGRAVQVTILIAAVVIGLRARTTAGMGAVTGALVVPVWLVISAMFDFGGAPVSLAGRNPGVRAPVVPATMTVIALLGAVAMTVAIVMVARDRAARRLVAAVSDARV